MLTAYVDVDVHALDRPHETGALPAGVTMYEYDYPVGLAPANAAIKTLGVDLETVDSVREADIPHSHTWCANMAGHIGGMLYGIPYVISAHSLEPLRPWKYEQLGGGYEVSSWVKQTAYEVVDGIVAVPFATKGDILRRCPKTDPGRVRVIHNEINLSSWNAPKIDEETAAIRECFTSYGLDPDKPIVMFAGRIIRQKGVPGLLRAITKLPPEIQVMLYIGTPDAPEIAAETEALVEDLRNGRTDVVWISDFFSHDKIIQLLSCSTVLVTPSIYGPLGIVNLEAMIVGLSVVGTKTGGIPGCIENGATGTLVPIEQLDDRMEAPAHPEMSEADLALALEAVCTNPEEAREMGAAGRERVEEHFSWESIVLRTMNFYRDIMTEP